jgi:hypothetical protein
MSVHHRPVEVIGVKVFGQSTSSAFYVKRYLQVLSSAFRLWPKGALGDIYRLQTLPALGHFVGNLLETAKLWWAAHASNKSSSIRFLEELQSGGAAQVVREGCEDLYSLTRCFVSAPLVR